MNRLQIRKMASDLAFDNINTVPMALDMAVAAKAQAANLTAAQYGQFKADTAMFLKQYQPANNQDIQDAKQVPMVAKPAIPSPQPTTAGTPELKVVSAPPTAATPNS